MPARWNIQVRARVRADLDDRLRHDLHGLVGASGAGTRTALVLPRSGHPLPLHVPNLFGHALIDDRTLEGPAFGPGVHYDGSRFDGLAGARIVAGELCVGVVADGLEFDVSDGMDGLPYVPGVNRLAAFVDFLTVVSEGPVGEVVGRINNDHHRYGHPMIRCDDGRVRVVHVSGLPSPGELVLLLPPILPVGDIQKRDSSMADLDEGAFELSVRALAYRQA